MGRAHKVTPRELVGAITGECGIPGRSIGAILIQDRLSMVEVAADRADGVLETLNNGVFIGGIKVTAVMEAGASGPHPRRPFTPGPRRLHPGVSGKKPRGATSGKKNYQTPR